jgi:hypothetical protein
MLGSNLIFNTANKADFAIDFTGYAYNSQTQINIFQAIADLIKFHSIINIIGKDKILENSLCLLNSFLSLKCIKHYPCFKNFTNIFKDVEVYMNDIFNKKLVKAQSFTAISKTFNIKQCDNQSFYTVECYKAINIQETKKDVEEEIIKNFQNDKNISLLLDFNKV